MMAFSFYYISGWNITLQAWKYEDILDFLKYGAGLRKVFKNVSNYYFSYLIHSENEHEYFSFF